MLFYVTQNLNSMLMINKEKTLLKKNENQHVVANMIRHD